MQKFFRCMLLVRQGSKLMEGGFSGVGVAVSKHGEQDRALWLSTDSRVVFCTSLSRVETYEK